MFLVAEPFADISGEDVTDRAEMTEGHIIAAGDLFHGRMGDSREQSHDKAQGDGTDCYERSAAESANGQDNANHAGHV